MHCSCMSRRDGLQLDPILLDSFEIHDRWSRVFVAVALCLSAQVDCAITELVWPLELEFS